ncbi:FG-GAP-like repeat-containing protein [Streptomyces yaanensis]|uniref:FG-GAP-like repeat-containing protein n=1 Tax=Streptomyces yaanensis TaxID=1142239 RepID=A0ABV7SMT3_9ACTN|nr:FG-GAP-like repeat-containing protein [Streptomyces sp. CGMCC 4.7035]WNC01932.1 FG-GAP-like repeat-containing protein [Streptomyces sp. CGMCC 4.7035]
MIRPLNRRARRHQRALGRIALTVTLAVTAGIGTAAGTAVAEVRSASADPVVISTGARFVPRATIVLNAGETGFLTAQEGDDRLRWIDYATGATTILEHRLPEPLAYNVDEFRFAKYPGDFGHGSDTVALYADSPTPHVTLQQRAGGGSPATVPIPEGQTYVATYGDTVITRTGTENAVTNLHLLRLENGEVLDRKLEGLPEGWNLSVSEGDARSVAVRGIKWEDTTMSQGWWVVDLATGGVKALSPHGESVSFDRDTVFQFGAPSNDAALVYRRDNLDAEPTTVDLRDVASYNDVVRPLGDGFVTVTPPNPGDDEYRGNQLFLRDATGSSKSLLAVASPSVHRTPDGSLLVAGAEENTTKGALDWGYYLFTPAADGTVTRKRLADIEDREAKPAGISLGSGILTTADDSQYYSPGTYIGGYRSTWLKTSGRPEELNSTIDGLVSGRDDDCSPAYGTYCVTMFASGDGYHGRKAATEQGVTMLYRNGAAPWGPRVTSRLDSPQLVDLSGRFGIVNQASGGQQAILHFKDADTGSVLLKREPVAASVWGNTLWSALGRWDDTGSNVPTGVAAKNLSTGAAGDSFDAGCVPSDLQAVGRWVYWRCSDYWHDFKGAGVYDRQAKRFLKLGADETLLGDGYLVHRSDATGLTLVDLHNGLPLSGKEADLPQRVVATAAELGDRTGRRSGWTVDRFGGHVAYTGEDRRVRIVPSGVPASRIAVIDADTPAMDSKAGAWTPRWWLSKPAATWSLTMKNKATGKTVRTFSGGEARGLIAPSWDGKDAAGKYVPNGAYVWTLTAKPADGVQADLSVSGTVPVTGGAAVWRDMVGDDGFGDLLAMDTTGAVSLYRGTGTGALSSRIAGSGSKFVTDSVLVPVGDVNGDRCADVLVRVGDQLRAYRPGCGKTVTASSPYTLIGAGWAQYDQLTSPGDVNGDGFVDLIARQASTGDVYFYAGTADHRLKARLRIGTNWKLYKRIVGAGDLNGDGRGDLLGVDSAGVLWRYYGTSTGGVTTRVRVGSGWGAYSALVGVGDLSGDGRADLLARDTAGKLWRYASTGVGTYGGRVLIGSGGWNGFKGLF